MLLFVFVGMATFWGLIAWAKLGFPINPAIIFAAIIGVLRGAWTFVWTQSIWVVLWYALLIISVDIVTPPYLIDVESLLAVPVGMWISNNFGLSLAWALGIAFAATFLIAAIIIILHFLVVKKMLK